MKTFAASPILAAALLVLAGAAFFALAGNRPEGSGDPAAADSLQDGLAALGARVEARMAEIEGRIEQLDRSLEALRQPEAARMPEPAVAGAGAGEETEGEAASDEEEAQAPSSPEKRALVAALGKARAQELQGFVRQVIQEEREERQREDLRRAQERQREIAEFSQGPYGRFNLRVNSLARRLGLSEDQKLRYHALLSDYFARFEEASNAVDRKDQAAYQAYRERRTQMQEEFDGLVIQSLTPPQAQEYQKLQPFERSAGPEAQKGLVASSAEAADGGTAPLRFFLRAGGEGGDAVMADLLKTSAALPAGKEGGAEAGGSRGTRPPAGK